MIRRVSLLVVLLALPALGLAQQKRPMTIDDIIALNAVSDAQISPDGKWVAYVVSRADMKENAADADVWMVAAAGGEPIRLTTSKKNDNQPRWSPDGKRIAFISAREEKAQIFLISPTGGEAERLTESKTPVQSFRWSPDGQRIAYVALREPTAEEEKKEKEKDDAQVFDADFKYARLWTIDVAKKTRTELVKEDREVSDPQWSPDGASIAYVATPTPKADDGSLSDIYIVDAQSGRSRMLITNEGPDTSPRWSPSGREIAFLTRGRQNGTIGQLQLSIVSPAGGTPRAVATQFQYQAGAPQWSPEGTTLFFTSSTRTTSQLFSVPASGGTPKQLSSADGVVGAPTFTRDGSLAAFTLSDSQHPADVHVAKLQPAFAATKITDHNTQIAGIALGRYEVTRWKSVDGREIEGMIVYPVGYEAGKPYPTHVQVHGGPSGVWTQAFPGSWSNFAHVWAGRGWVSFYPNIRGSSGYGEPFLLANVRDWGGNDYRDVQSGIDALVQKGIADPNRLAQSGWSYGGYMTAWTLTQTNRFKAVMVGAGLTNMYSMYSTNDLQRTLDSYFGAAPWDDVAAFQRASAMTFIKNAKTPTLIQHGAADNRVPQGQARELYMGLKMNGVPVELVLYPREPHGLGEPRHQLDKMRRELEWFTKYVLTKTSN